MLGKTSLLLPVLSTISLMCCKSSSEMLRIEIRLEHPEIMINNRKINILFNFGLLEFTKLHKKECEILFDCKRSIIKADELSF